MDTILESDKKMKGLIELGWFKGARNVGAPGSIMRYCTTTSWGDNQWAVMEYVNNRPVCRAAGSKAGCEQYMTEGRFLINVGAI